MIRPERATDVEAIDSVVEAAFGQRDEADLVTALRADDSWLPALSLVAIDDDRIVGHIAFSRATVDGAPVLALAPLSVLPGHQGRGFGSALVEEALRRAAGSTRPPSSSSAIRPYYGRFGFRPARELGITGPFGDIDEFQAMALSSPASSGRIAYAAPFGIADASGD